MISRPALAGIRVHLSGSIHLGPSDPQIGPIESFIKTLAQELLREGATVVHGSHPSMIKPLEEAAHPFVSAGGSKDSMTLVRAQKFAVTAEQQAEMATQRQYAAVHVIPASFSQPTESLVPMREWMAERSDAIVAIAGKGYAVRKDGAGVAAELEEALTRGKPAFLVGGFGGAVASILEDNDALLGELKNGLSKAENRALATTVDINQLVNRIISQLKLLPLSRRNTQTGRLFRILALDGGGLRGAFTAAVLSRWDDMLKSGGGTGLVQHFDLVAGTSTGAILAIGLGLGLSPLKLLEFYRNEGPKIFPRNRQLRHWLKSKHDSDTLRTILVSVFADRKLSESCCRLVIPTVRAVHGESEAIVTPHAADRTGFASITAVNAAIASSAAPTYFDEGVVDDSVAVGTYLDGGIWANNPVLPAIAEAVRYLKVPLDRIDVLNVGTMGNESDFTQSLGKGKAGWATASTDLFFAAQEHAATSLADSFLSRARHLRVNQQTPTEIKLDDIDAINDVASRGANVGRDSFIAVRSRFLDGFLAPDWRTAQPTT